MAALEGWLKHHQIHLHPSLCIVQDEQGCSIRASAPLEPSTSGASPSRVPFALSCSLTPPVRVVARIPKSAILSQRTCSLGAARLAQLPPQLPETLRLAVCLLHEQLLGVESRWTDYIGSLPSTSVPIAVLWPVDGEARRWAQGTELAKVLDQAQQDEVSPSSAPRTAHLQPQLAAHPRHLLHHHPPPLLSVGPSPILIADALPIPARLLARLLPGLPSGLMAWAFSRPTGRHLQPYGRARRAL